jgi:isoquinoline 1-oxidoreductase subunit beta
MKEKIDTGRRSFVIGATIGFGGIVTGFVSGFDLMAQIKSFDKDTKTLALEPNIWVEIRKDNTIIITIPRSELGQGVRTSLSMILAEELDADWNNIKPVNAVGDAKYIDQSTGGSTSIRVFWNTLRNAGAQARLMFITAAAQTWGIAENQCRTENSYVFEIGGSRSMSYGDLIDKASSLPIPPESSIKLKQPSEFKIIGKTKWHIDNPEVVTGKAIFGSDFKYEAMKYAIVLRAPEIGGSLKSFDDTQAKDVPGFVAAYQIPQGVAVVANSTYQAMNAADKINAEWNPGPISNKDSKIISDELKAKLGNLPDLPSSTVKQIESVYEVPLLAHSTMEPMNSFAHFHDNRCDVWTITQNPQTARRNVAQAVALPESAVTVNVLLAGGGFGRGHNNEYIQMAARISKLSGYPIKLMYTKSNDIRNDYYRPFSIHAIKSGIDSTGKITGWVHKTASQGSVIPTNPQYQVPNVRNLNESINYSVPTGPWRSVNNTQIYFANESMLDELAVLANADPLRFRLDITNNPRLKGVIELAAEKAEWSKELPKNWGHGIASFVGYGGFAAHVVEVSVNDYGILKVERIVAAVDCGIAINPGNIEAQFMGAAIDALSTAIKAEITIKNGRIEQSGFNNYEWLTMRESPKIEVHIVQNNESPGGIGELGFPSVSPALCNAIYDACGVRVRRLPIKYTSLLTSVNESKAQNDTSIKVYPNPFDDYLNIDMDLNHDGDTKIEFIIYDILGNKIYSSNKNYISSRITEKINLANVLRGSYTLIIQNGKHKHAQKIVKNN